MVSASSSVLLLSFLVKLVRRSLQRKCNLRRNLYVPSSYSSPKEDAELKHHHPLKVLESKPRETCRLYTSMSDSPQKILISFVSTLVCILILPEASSPLLSSLYPTLFQNDTMFYSLLFLKTPSSKNFWGCAQWLLLVLFNSFSQAGHELLTFREAVKDFCYSHPCKSPAPSHNLKHAWLR